MYPPAVHVHAVLSASAKTVSAPNLVAAVMAVECAYVTLRAARAAAVVTQQPVRPDVVLPTD